MTDMEIAQTILAQLGGRRFSMITGAKQYVAIDSGLRFTVAGRDGVNRVTITLTAADLYDVRFIRYSPRSLSETVVSAADGIFCDMLQDVFESGTGLFTTLAARK